MNNTVLVTGGTGKTGRRLVQLLTSGGIAHRIASRQGSTSSFDWTKPPSWQAALRGVSAIYLVAPPIGTEAPDLMIEFVKQALASGASRFVLLSASLLPAGGPAMGKVHLWLKENVPQWCVLRPSWFMQNFSEAQHAQTIREEDAIYSATGDGHVAFVSADDIAAAAFASLTTSSAANSDFILTGGRTLSYDEVAKTIGDALKRPIRHVGITIDELAQRYQARGMPVVAARTLAAMDGAIAAGAENRMTSSVHDLTGRTPISFEDFVVGSLPSWKT